MDSLGQDIFQPHIQPLLPTSSSLTISSLPKTLPTQKHLWDAAHMLMIKCEVGKSSPKLHRIDRDTISTLWNHTAVLQAGEVYA